MLSSQRVFLTIPEQQLNCCEHIYGRLRQTVLKTHQWQFVSLSDCSVQLLCSCCLLLVSIVAAINMTSVINMT